jgi:anhydro-N-acetylmuramic acid kinase
MPQHQPWKEGSPELRIAHRTRVGANRHDAARYFVGLFLDHHASVLNGALIRVWGAGLQVVPDIVATAQLATPLLRSSLLAGRATSNDSGTIYRRPAAELAEMAASVIGPLVQRVADDVQSVRAVGLQHFGHWIVDAMDHVDYFSCCDTALLAKLSGLTVIDDFPGRDLAQGGRGGPLEATGAWLMLADRGIVPGRVIRALVDVGQSTRLYLLPPRQPLQLPNHLHCQQLGPGMSLWQQIMQELTSGSKVFDPSERWSVQARQIPELRAAWDRALPLAPQSWSHAEVDVEPLLAVVRTWPQPLASRLSDVVCTATHWVADRIVHAIRNHLPRSQPVGQLILSGPVREHPLLVHHLARELPELQITSIDHVGVPSDSWQAASSALLAVLHVDQIPSNCADLTNADTPRVLGRITPGPPGNWHHVLADMARTLPEKMTLRSAI